ncbi:uncharacterized protein ACBR49_013220 [Aulostomus maculatus]
MTSATSTCESSPSEDPLESMPELTNGNQSDIKVKPVPRPRSKYPLKSKNNNNTADKAGSTVSCHNTEDPCPLRPPTRPQNLTYVTCLNPSPNGDDQFTSNTDTSAKEPQADSDKQRRPPPPPPRPPPPSNYHDTQTSNTRQTPERRTEEAQYQRSSSVDSNMLLDISGTPGEMPTGIYRPTGSSRSSAYRRSSITNSASLYGGSPLQVRSPPAFSPPAPPSINGATEPVYTEIPDYVTVLPNDDHNMAQLNRPGGHQPAIEDTEDINGMLKWLKRESRPHHMSLSLYGLSLEQEIREFNQRALKVKQALRLYNLLMMKRNESMRDTIANITAMSNNLDKFEKRVKNMGIAGGTTGAVGGATAVVGIALAPVTMGTSLIATAVGVGMVAAAGGMGAHANKPSKKTVTRTTVVKLLKDYETNVADIEHCLVFILCGMNELQRHDLARLQRAGAHLDALRVAHLSQSVLRSEMNNGGRTSAAPTGGMSSVRLIQAFDKEMDQYFKEKDKQRLRKSTKSRFSSRVRLLAQNLQDELDYLNYMWEMFC